MTTSMPVIAPVTPVGGPLPLAGSVLVVTARPGQESVDLGGLLYAFRRTGADLGLLCLTRGEGSPLNSTCARLEAIRPWELQLAASILGISPVAVANYPDSGLRRQPMAELTEQVRRAIRQQGADLLLVIDPAAGDPDEGAAVAVAACAAARQAGGAGRGVHQPGCPRLRGDRSGCRDGHRPRHPEIRYGRARQPVPGAAPAGTPT